MANILEVKDLYKKFKDVVAVDNLSFSVKEGEIFGLLGPNGAGKSTAINVITGLIENYSGQVIIDGEEFKGNEKSIERKIGLVPQELAIYVNLSAEDNVRFFGELYGLKGKELDDAVDRSLSFVGIESVRKKKSNQFSGGMKRRLNIACGIVHSPKLLIMDEPTVGIDPQSRNHIMESIKRLNNEGTTILYTTHYMEEAEELCDRLTIMDLGQVIAQGSISELQNMISDSQFLEVQLPMGTLIDEEEILEIKGVKNVLRRENQIEIESDKDVYNLSTMIEYFTDRDIEIRDIYTKKPNLENVFLSLTGKKLRD